MEDVSAIEPMDVYGWTKLHGENYLNYFHQQQRVDGLNVRLFNVVGSGETNPHLAPAIIEQLNDNVSSIKLGNLFPQRDYINVRDAAEGFWRLANASSGDKSAQISNLGTGTAHEVGEMVKLIARASGRELNIEQDQDRVRAVDRPMLLASIDRIQSLTGWRPEITLAESMSDAWNTRELDKLL